MLALQQESPLSLHDLHEISLYMPNGRKSHQIEVDDEVADEVEVIKHETHKSLHLRLRITVVCHPEQM